MSNFPKPTLLLLFLLCTCGLAPNNLCAQREFTSSLSISLLDEHVGLPFQHLDVFDPDKVHPGVAITFESSRDRPGIYQFSRAVELGYYYHEDNEQAFYLALKPRLRFVFADLLDLHFVPGLGYARTFSTSPSYRPENGTFTEFRNPGKSHFMPSLGVGVGLQLYQLTGVPLTIFARHESFLLWPSAHTLTRFGLSFSFQ